MMVMLAEGTELSSSTSVTTLCSLSDPCLEHENKESSPSSKSHLQRQYFVTVTEKESFIHEIQSTNEESEYSSFFVDSNVVSNGNMYLASKVDPLFFLLNICKDAAARWAPLDQICSSFPFKIGNASRQLMHLCEVNDELGDDLVLYKFSEERALMWLSKKFDAVYNVMKEVAIDEKRQGDINRRESSRKALILEADDQYKNYDLSMKDELECVDSSVIELTKQEDETVKITAYDVVCEYLNNRWREKLSKSLDLPNKEDLDEDVADGVQSKGGTGWECDKNIRENAIDKINQYTFGMVVSPEHEEKEAKAKLNTNQSVGLKRLKKVNTKGMKNLGSFFSVKKKAKKI